jgi:hypothetical protein
MNLIKATKRKVFLEGRTFGKLFVDSYIGSNEKSRESMYSCTCQCGATGLIVSHGHLSSGHTTTCGGSEHKGTHRMSNDPVYDIWISIKQRVSNPNSQSWENYGGRGITMDSDLFDSFEKFKECIGERPSRHYSVERIDVNGNYSRGNIKWASTKEQGQNKRKLKTNKSGVTGVYKTINKGIEYYVASVQYNNGSKKNRYFNVGILGEETAFNLAVKCRESLLIEANQNGECYSANHGK